MKHKTGIILLLIGGAFMVIGNAIGTIGVFEFLQGYVVASVPTEWVSLVNDIMTLFKWIAEQGGWAIIGGTVLIMIGLMKIGKFIVWIGLTFGSLALIIWIITQIVNATGISLGPQLDTLLSQIYSLFTYNTGFAFSGVALAVIGKASIKKVSESKAKVVESSDEHIFCPECGKELPKTANFCSECGKTFD
ncbi:MAG: zinc-ribbon domain-containing protein [Promethearchaeota archaeon]